MGKRYSEAFHQEDERQMAKFTLNMKRCATPLAIQEMQIQTMRYSYTTIRMANIKKKKKKTDYTKRWQGETRPHIAGGDIKWRGYSAKQFASIFEN